MQEYDPHPLIKDVPGHLFRFEEKIFGVMTLTQFLCDLSAGIGILALTASLSLHVRIVVSLVLALPVLLLVHGKVQEYSLVYWLYLLARSLTLPRQTSWRSHQSKQGIKRKRRGERRPLPAIQTTWIPFDSLEGGIAGYSEPGNKRGDRGRYWVAFEVEGRTIRYLPQIEQLRLFSRFEAFFTGLSFRVQLLSLTSQVYPREYAPLRAQKAIIHQLHNTPRLAALQEASAEFQQRHLYHCTEARHYLVISVSVQEEVLRQRLDEQQGMLTNGLRLLFRRKQHPLTREEVQVQLRIRCSVMRKALQQLDIRTRPLADSEQLNLFASCLSLGTPLPPFVPEHWTVRAGRNTPLCIRGLHAILPYQGRSTRFEAKQGEIADLVAPSQITLHPDKLEIDIRGQKR